LKLQVPKRGRRKKIKRKGKEHEGRKKKKNMSSMYRLAFYVS
jgi:hypothetical protein